MLSCKHKKFLNINIINKLFSTKAEAKDAINHAVNVIELPKTTFNLKNSFHEENSKIESYVKGLVQKNHPLLDIIGQVFGFSQLIHYELWNVYVR